MTFLLLIPVILSCLVLAAHLLHSGPGALVLIALAMPFLLLIKRKGSARALQVYLVLGALEWVRRMNELIAQYAEEGKPAKRMMIILSCVAAVTLLSAGVFQLKRVNRRYFAQPDAQPAVAQVSAT